MKSVSRSLELAFWSVLPGIVTLLCIFLYTAPKYIGIAGIMPLMQLAAIYFWGIHRPREVPYWFLFLSGILTDALQGTPLGVSSILYILFLLILLSQLKHVYKEGFILKWVFFAVLLLVIMGIQWVCMLVVTSQFYPLSAPLVQWLVTVGLYPLLHVCFTRLASAAAHRRWKLQHAS